MSGAAFVIAAQVDKAGGLAVDVRKRAPLTEVLPSQPVDSFKVLERFCNMLQKRALDQLCSH